MNVDINIVQVDAEGEEFDPRERVVREIKSMDRRQIPSEAKIRRWHS